MSFPRPECESRVLKNRSYETPHIMNPRVESLPEREREREDSGQLFLPLRFLIARVD